MLLTMVAAQILFIGAPSITSMHHHSPLHFTDTPQSQHDLRQKHRRSLQETVACPKNVTNTPQLLLQLVQGYDERIRPSQDQHPTYVRVRMRIIKVSKIDEINMDFTLDIQLTQEWSDPRLANHHSGQLLVPDSMIEKLWRPDTYFSNSKHAQGHRVTVPNTAMTLKTDGTLVYDSRLTVRADCPMEFRLYPLDVQTCELRIESFGYTFEDIQYQWMDKRTRLTVSKEAGKLPQQKIIRLSTSKHVSWYPLGKYSMLKLTVVIRRDLYYFFLHLYLPCCIVVMLAWMSFFIPKERVGARIKLCIMAALTILMILELNMEALPKGPYVKLADLYLIASILFVGAVFLEYVVLLWLTEREMMRVEAIAKERKRRSGMANISNNLMKPGQLQVAGESAFFGVGDEDISEEFEDDEDRESQGLADTHFVYVFSQYIREKWIDETVRIWFAASYAVFNLAYWIIFFVVDHIMNSEYQE